jgi:regulatory protein
MRRAAVDYLSKHSSSTANLRAVLERKARRRIEDPEADIASLVGPAVQFCVEQGFVDDVAYAETKVAAAARKGVSSRKVAMQLRSKGVDAEHVADALREVDDLAAAVRFARKRRVGPWRTTDEPDRDRELGKLARQGFDEGTCRRVFLMELTEAEDVLFGVPDRDDAD